MEKSPPNRDPQLNGIVTPNFSKLHPQNFHAPKKMEKAPPGKDFTPWVYALYRVNKRVLTRKIGQFRVTLRDITP
jgi:hypothetical protein